MYNHKRTNKRINKIYGSPSVYKIRTFLLCETAPLLSMALKTS